MSNRHQYAGVLGGRCKQAGAPAWAKQQSGRRAHGLSLSGVVVTTYVPLDGGSPFPQGTDDSPTAVYCDVVTYGTGEGMYACFIKGAAVLQGTGMHHGHVWKPRAATINVTGELLNTDSFDPRDLDGDHVLVQFLEDNLDKPIITGLLPHPSAGIGNVDLPEVGHRMLLKVADGDPDFVKHHGSFYGLDKDGNFRLDTTRAHDGRYGSEGEEVPAEDEDHGNVVWKVSNQAAVTIVGVDKDGANEKFRLVLENGNLTVKMGDDPDKALVLDTNGSELTVRLGGASLTLQGSGGGAELAVGSGAKHVPIVEALQQFYETLKNSHLTPFDSHIHSAQGALLDGFAIPCSGTVGTPTPTISAPAWDSSINSSKVSIPNG